MTSRTLAGLLLLGGITGMLPAAETVHPARLVENFGRAVFPVEFRLRLAEPPRGGEGPSNVQATTAVLVREDGLLLAPGDPVPDPDGGPRTLIPVDWKVVLPEGERVPAELVGADRDLNLAFLRTDPGALTEALAVMLAKAPQPAVGDRVLVLSPLPADLGRTVSYRRNEIVAVLDDPEGMAVFDLPLDDLEIGGLVLRESGEPLGVIGEKVLEGGEPELKPFGLLRLFGSTQQGPVGGYPVLLTGRRIAGLIESPPPLEEIGEVPRGWLGITMQPLNEDLAAYWDIEGDGGVIIGAVVEDSPAYRAGLRTGDVILELGGEALPIRGMRELPEVRRRVRRAGPGAPLEIAYWRDGERRHTTVELGTSPATLATAERYESERFGLTVRELTYDLRQRINLAPEVQGVVVDELNRGGWAALAGVRPGDLVLQVDGQGTPDLPSFRTALERMEEEQVPEVQFLLQRRFKTFFLPVPTEWKR
jgi:serine protease Do